MLHLVFVHYLSFLQSELINHKVFISISVILYFHYYGFHVYFTSKFLTLIPTFDPIRSSSSNSNSSFEHRYDPLSSHIGITKNSENNTRQLAKLTRTAALTDLLAELLMCMFHTPNFQFINLDHFANRLVSFSEFLVVPNWELHLFNFQ